LTSRQNSKLLGSPSLITLGNKYINKQKGQRWATNSLIESILQPS
jgi:hypothetical protein